MEGKISYLELFLIFFKINAITFGGGYTIVPVIREEISIKRKLIDEETMMDIVGMAQTAPGAMATSTSILTGYKLKGIRGAIVSLIASVLPCIIIIALISYFYQEFSENFWVRSALLGMGGVISAILLMTAYNLGRIALKRYPIFSFVMMVTAFIFSFILHIPTAFVIFYLGMSGLLVFSFVKEVK